MKTTFKSLLPFIIIFTAILLLTAILAASRACHSKKPANAISNATYRVTAPEDKVVTADTSEPSTPAFQEDTAAVIPSRERMNPPTLIASFHSANFSNPLRKPPIRRKGQIQG